MMHVPETPSSVRPRSAPPYQFIPQVAGALTILIGGAGITGWVFNINFLKGVSPASPSMKFNTALLFVLAGASLRLSAAHRATRGARLVTRALGGGVAFIGSLTLAEYVFGLQLGIDQLLMRVRTGAGDTPYPGRMSPHSALCFLLAGGALLSLTLKVKPRATSLMQSLVVLVLLIALLALIGQTYGVAYSYGVSTFPGMATYTAAAFIALGVGILFARPDSGLMSVVTGEGAGGVMARRLLPAAVGLPVALGWLKVEGERAGFYDTAFGTSAMVVSSIAILAALIWRNADSLNRKDVARRRAEESLRKSHDGLEATVAERTRELTAANEQLQAEVSERRRAEESLRENAHHYRHLAEAMPQIVWTARADGYIDYYNRRWVDYTGMTVEQTQGWGWQPVLHPEDVEHCLRRWATAVETGGSYEIEYRFKRASDGQYRWHLGRAVPMRDAAGRVVKWFGTCTDIHDQKHSAEALRFLAEAGSTFASSLDHEIILEQLARLSISALGDHCLVDVVGDDGNVRRVVAAHADASKKELMSAFRAYPPDPRKPLGIYKVLRTGAPEVVPEVTEEKLREMARGEEHLALLRELGLKSFMTVPLVARARTVGALTVGSAQSPRRYGGDDLALFEELARRAALAVDNSRLYRNVREANRAKDEFLATLSHELRTPLTPIIGWVHMMLSGRLPPADITKGLEVIDKNSQALARLINDLLDMSAILSGKMRVERVPLRLDAAITEAVETVRAQADSRRVRIEVDAGEGAGESPAVAGDRTRLAQVFWNLLTNAVKFSGEGGRVSVSCRADEGRARIAIADEGQGIAPDFLPFVFERFRQADSSTTRAHGGLGIGLALVKSIVEAHGGAVGVESAGPGRGSCFTVTLPLLHAPTLPAAPDERQQFRPAASTPPLSDENVRRVLIVEDAPDTLDMLTLVFESHGFRVTACQSASEALRVAPTLWFDTIVSDIGLPQTDGYELIKRLREMPHLRNVPAVALTGYAASTDAARSLAAGFDAHIPKPVDLATLTERVEQLKRQKPLRAM